MPASFGNTVRVAATPETERAGLAGLVGTVVGETKPSVSGVSVIGGLADDFALSVHFEERKESHWFNLDLLQFVDVAAGSTVRAQGAGKEQVRRETGQWEERDLPVSGWRRFMARLRGRA